MERVGPLGMRQILRVLAATAVGLALLSCGASPQPQRVVEARRPPAVYGNSTYAHAETPPQDGPRLVWRASPRWATVKEGGSTGAVHQDPQAKFKAAVAKAEKLGVHTLTNEDIDGLSPAQLKAIRGY
jgi:hypothetical protein